MQIGTDLYTLPFTAGYLKWTKRTDVVMVTATPNGLAWQTQEPGRIMITGGYEPASFENAPTQIGMYIAPSLEFVTTLSPNFVWHITPLNVSY